MNGENIAVISDRLQVALKCTAVYLNTAVFKFLMYFGDSGPSVLRDRLRMRIIVTTSPNIVEEAVSSFIW